MIRMTMLIVSAVLLSGSALAQTATAADTQAINACLRSAEDNGSFGNGCIGKIADPCIEKASKTNSYIEDSKKCAARELAVWSGLMTKAINTFNKNGPPEKRGAIAGGQKSWAESIGKFCPAFEKLDPDMTLGGSVYCRMQETAHRTLLLRKLAAAVSEH